VDRRRRRRCASRSCSTACARRRRPPISIAAPGWRVGWIGSSGTGARLAPTPAERPAIVDVLDALAARVAVATPTVLTQVRAALPAR
jgi:hypothetical protein